jgi:hypothetical protein
MKAVSNFVRLLPALALLTGMSINSYGQSIYGGVRGLVVDASGGALANAKVTLTDEGTNASRATVTSASGEYNFSSVIPATYSIVAESPGFKKVERKGVIVGTQQFLTVDVKLEVGNVTESIMVTEEVPLIETANASRVR